jgi:predicted  nucleic acid-binding Zn-ribbon protein
LHPDLKLIVDLWALDQKVDQARARAVVLKAVVGELGDLIQAKILGLEVTVISARESQIREAAIQVDLDKYIMRTARTKKLLDGHQMVDFATVEKQLTQCGEHVNRLEMDMLVEMEVAEGISLEAQALKAAQSKAEQNKVTAHAAWLDEGRELRKEIEAIWPDRIKAAAELNRELEKRYKGFRERSQEPVSALNGEFCSACHVSVQAQMRLEVSTGRRVHNCRGCGRWLLPMPESTDEGELDPNDAAA